MHLLYEEPPTCDNCQSGERKLYKGYDSCNNPTYWCRPCIEGEKAKHTKETLRRYGTMGAFDELSELLKRPYP